MTEFENEAERAFWEACVRDAAKDLSKKWFPLHPALMADKAAEIADHLVEKRRVQRLRQGSGSR